MLATATLVWVVLTGRTSELEKYVNRELTLEGTRGDDGDVEWSSKLLPSLDVDRIVKVHEKPKPQLDDSFLDKRNWLFEGSKKYGVKFARPRDTTPVDGSNSPLHGNFVTPEGVESINAFEIPASAYPNTNLHSGVFAILVNRQLTNPGSCIQFGYERDGKGHSYRAGKLQYASAEEHSAAAGTGYDDYYFHIFEGGLCYEIAFELVDSSSPGGDTGCNIPLLSSEDDFNLIKPLLESMSFDPPEVRFAVKDNQFVPQVTDFRASSQTADNATNRGLINFNWATVNTDYIEFTYTCLDPSQAAQGGVSWVVISENGSNRYCKNIPRLKAHGAEHFYRPPNSSVDIDFGYFNHEDSTSVVVTVTPFSHGVAYPGSEKSLTVMVNPNNPFSRGVPIETRNMTLDYEPNANGTETREQGSSLTIRWTDARAQDPCVNLYLVQDNGAGGENYLLQINGKLEIGCLRPASGGSYTWTVTSRYSGSHFRVLAATPGGTSGTLGPAFDIVKPEASSVL
jgi:hypothetical protein